MRSAIIAGLLATAGALTVPMPRDTSSYSSPPQSVFYFTVNKKDASSIVAVDTRPNANTFVPTLTGGRGGIVIDNATNQDVGIDVLQSAYSIIVDGNYLFAVSSGSNQLSMFNINPSDPLHPKIVGSPVGTNGDFPNSVTYSRKLNKACVLNAGKKNGVQCFNVNKSTGLTPDGGFRSTGIPQTNPPGLFNGSSAILFNKESTQLIATARYGPMVIYPVQNGQVSQNGVTTVIKDMVLPFGPTWISENSVFVADPSYGGSLLTVQKNKTLTEGPHKDLRSPVDIFDMSCWSVYVPRTEKVYTFDADRPHLGVYDAKTGVFLRTSNYTDQYAGGLDSLLDNRDGKTVWFLTAHNVLASYDTTTEKLTDPIIVDTFYAGARHYWQGLAQWTLSPKY